MVQVFSFEISEIFETFKNTFFIEHVRSTASFHCRITEACLVGSYQTSLMQLFAKIVDGQTPLTIFAKQRTSYTYKSLIYVPGLF